MNVVIGSDYTFFYLNQLCMNKANYLRMWADRYKTELTDSILPFWIEHGLDTAHGGVYTSLDRQGMLMDTTKSVWFQGRFGFITAFAYNRIQHNPEWLLASKSCIDFIEKYCFDAEGHMYFEVKSDGTPLRKRRYVFSECFAIIAMSEYSIASGDRTYAEKALALFKNTLRFLSTPGFLPAKYLPTLQAKGHSITMILINTASRLREALPDELLDNQIDESIDLIRRYFMHPEYKALLEMVGPNGELIDTCNGRTINPGHCIETAWFLLEEARHRDWDKNLVDTAIQIFDWSWDWGWDKQYGGLLNFRDCKGFPAQDYSQDMKFWWPHTEAIIATLYAYRATGNQIYLDRHKEVNDWTYAHFPDKEYPEWYGYLHRDGSVAQPAKGNMFKGPFHIPRMMIYGYGLCEELLNISLPEKK